MTIEEWREQWSREAREALRLRPEAQANFQTTETTAWAAGFVEGYVAAREVGMSILRAREARQEGN